MSHPGGFNSFLGGHRPPLPAGEVNELSDTDASGTRPEEQRQEREQGAEAAVGPERAGKYASSGRTFALTRGHGSLRLSGGPGRVYMRMMIAVFCKERFFWPRLLEKRTASLSAHYLTVWYLGI